MKRMILSKRSLALVLALMMTLSVVYVPAFAATTVVDEHVCDFSGEPHVVAPDHNKGTSGYTYYECQVEGCDKVQIDPNSIVKPGDCRGEHTWKTVAAVEPTCRTKGNVEYKVCTVCGQYADKDENLVVDAKAFELATIAHKMTEWSVTTDYNCTNLYMTRECVMCDLVEEVEWTESEHTFVPVFDETYLAPTCSANGKVTFVCVAEHTLADGTVLECSKAHVDVKINPTRAHTTVFHEAVAPTCTEDGSIAYHECTSCGRYFNVANPVNPGSAEAITTSLVVPALGHEMGAFAPVEGYVCGAENNMVADCSRCDHKEYQTRQHNYVAFGTAEEVISETECVKTTTTKTKCEYCEDVQSETTSETYHKQVVTLAAVKATCTTDGLTAGKKCEACGVVTQEQTVVTAASVAASHKSTYVPAGVPVKVTCTTDGITAGKKCPQCNIVVEAPVVVKAKGHTFNTEKIEPTCSDWGYEIGGFCSTCGYEDMDKVLTETDCSPKDEKVLVSEATCTSPALYKTVCKWCDCVCQNNIPVGEKNPTNHDGSLVIDVAASVKAECLTNGFAYAVCDDCEVIIMVIPNGASATDEDYKDAAYNHKPVTVWMTETEFNTTYPNLLTFTVTATGHNEPTDPTTVENATCTDNGLKTWVCANAGCNHVLKTEVINATGHDESDGYVVTTAPTCTAEGVETLTCKTCGEVLGARAVAALGHKKPAEYTVTTAPTCTTAGVGKYFCENNCGTQIDADVVIPAKGHTEDTGVTTDATCQATGKTVYSCVDCGVEMRVVVIPTVAHDYEETSTTATCTNAGVKTFTCKFGCGTTYTEAAPATGHAYAETPDVHTPATCFATGVKKWTCTNNCGHVEEEVLPVVNHTLEEVVYKMTCQSAGYTNLECTAEGCGYKAKVAGSDVAIDVTKAEAHSFNGYSGAVITASCSVAEGKYTKKCEHCDTTEFVDTITYDATKGHGTLEVVNGELVYVSAHGDDKNVSVAGKWTYVEHVSNKCQAGVVGGYICEICDHEEVLNSEYADKAVGTALEAIHNLTASAKVPSCEGLGELGWTYHEYCEDCTYGHTPDGTWEFIACTPCVSTTIPAVAPTCTEAGYGEYTYCPCHATKAEIEALKAAVEIPATNHAGTKENRTYAATCLEAGFVYEICTACNDHFKLVQYIAPLGHKVETFTDDVYNAMVNKYGVGNFIDGRAVAVTCSANGNEAGTICVQCLSADTFTAGKVIESVGHTNAAGEHFFDGDSCKAVAEGADRFCTTCNATIAVSHRVSSATSTQATCQSGEYSIVACVDCNEQQITYVRDKWTEEEHKAAIMGNKVDSKLPTPTEYGVDTYKCPHCDETITVLVPLAGGIEFELDYNVAYPVYEGNEIVGFEKSDRKETANGSWIAVDILVFGNEDFQFSQLDLSFTFNSNVVYFGSDMKTEVENLVVESVVAENGTVKVSAGVDPEADVDFASVNTVGEGAEGVVLATVYFQILPEKNVGEASFSFGADNTVWLADENDFVDITMFANFQSVATTVESVVLGEYLVDGVINGVELLAIKQMINGRLDATYDVALDLDKDGSITVVDYEILKELVNVKDVFASDLYETIASR